MTEVMVRYSLEPQLELDGPCIVGFHEDVIALGGLKSIESARLQLYFNENCQTTMMVCEALPLTLLDRPVSFDD